MKGEKSLLEGDRTEGCWRGGDGGIGKLGDGH